MTMTPWPIHLFKMIYSAEDYPRVILHWDTQPGCKAVPDKAPTRLDISRSSPLGSGMRFFPHVLILKSLFQK